MEAFEFHTSKAGESETIQPSGGLLWGEVKNDEGMN